MKLIPVGETFAMVDDGDFEFLSTYTWHEYKSHYTSYPASRSNGSKLIRMHQLLLPLTEGLVDHWNQNGLDNRRNNLRVSDKQRNSLNTPKKSHNTSGYKGVTWKKDKQKFKAYMLVSGEQIHLGYFDSVFEAALVYDRAMTEWAGDIADYNFTETRRLDP